MKMNTNYKFILSSPWPLMMSINFMCLTMNLMMKMNQKIMMTTFIMIVMSSISFLLWMNNSMNEKLLIGLKSNYNNMSMKPMIYIIMMTESMFFITFFYVNYSFNYFNNSMFNFKYYMSMFKLSLMMSFLNLMILLTSSLTMMEYTNMNYKNMNKSMMMMKKTMLLGTYFVTIQLFEYHTLTFNMSNSVFFSNFFMLTMFHMTHVIMGVLMMLYIQTTKTSYLMNNKTKIKMLCWYWHFVDTVWIFIFTTMYIK